MLAKKLSVRTVAQMGILIAIAFVLKLFTYYTPIGRFTLVPLAFVMGGILFGALWGGILAGISDILMALLYPSGGAFFAGYVLNSLLVGLLAGLYPPFKKEKPSWIQCFIFAFVSGILDLLLGLLWLSYLTGQGYLALLPSRILITGITIVMTTFIIHWLYPSLEKLRRKNG